MGNKAPRVTWVQSGVGQGFEPRSEHQAGLPYSLRGPRAATGPQPMSAVHMPWAPPCPVQPTCLQTTAPADVPPHPDPRSELPLWFIWGPQELACVRKLL